MKSYKATQVKQKTPVPPMEIFHQGYLDEMLKKYDLLSVGYTEEQVYLIWKQHSEDMCAGWLIDCPEDIERVFGVKLEEI